MTMPAVDKGCDFSCPYRVNKRLSEGLPGQENVVLRLSLDFTGG